MVRFARAALLAFCAVLLGACAGDPPKPGSIDLVIVVPDSEGRTGTVVVTSAQGTTTLDRPFAAARVEEGGRAAPHAVSQPQIEKVFGATLAAQPMRPVSLLLYFEEGTDEYTPESKKAFDSVFAEVARRPAAEIDVIGHTDRVGRVEVNDVLSLKRAERVRRDFIERGILPHAITVAGRGERETIIPTPDEVSEPRNRRVEINVR
jgi:outer membrane protein OmpA-like peptidoglycan-associated protein